MDRKYSFPSQIKKKIYVKNIKVLTTEYSYDWLQRLIWIKLTKVFFIVASPIKNSVKTTETWILPEYTQIPSSKPFFLYKLY